jgi:HEAT repeat protein
MIKNLFSVVGFVCLAQVVSSQIAYADDVDSLVARISTSFNDWAAQAKAENKLIAMGDAATGRLTQMLNDPGASDQTQWSIAMVLGKIGSSKAVPALASNLEATNNDWERGVVASALTSIGTSSADSMLAILAKRNNEIKAGAVFGPEAIPASKAASVLGKIGDQRAVDSIIALLQAEYDTSLADKSRWGATPYLVCHSGHMI